MAEADEEEYLEGFADNNPEERNGYDAYHDSDCGKYIYVFGGDVPPDGQGTVQKYTIEEDIWEPVPGVMPHSGRGTSVVLYGKYVWVIGGHFLDVDGRPHALSNVYAYDYKDNIWTEKEPLQHGRGFLGAARIGSRIYAFGGIDTNTAVGITEVYDVGAEWQGGNTQWLMCFPMVASRHNFGYYALFHHIYVAGGIGPTMIAMESMERFSPTTLQWTLHVASIGAARHSFGMGVADNGFVYAIGGDLDDTVSYFDPDVPNQWEAAGEMRLPRKQMSIVVASGIFYAVGGAIDDEITDALDCYNPETGNWMELTSMTSPRWCPAVLAFDTSLWGQH